MAFPTVSVRPRLRSDLECEGAEFLVLGLRLVERIQAMKPYTNFPGYDLVAFNPEKNSSCRIQVKSRWATDYDKSFPLKNTDTDFVVHAALNRGNRYRNKTKPDAGKRARVHGKLSTCRTLDEVELDPPLNRDEERYDLRSMVDLRVAVRPSSQRRVVGAAASVVVAVLLALVIAHGVSDAFHDAEAGATVCVALTLMAAVTRFLPSLSAMPGLFIELVLDPVVRLSDPLGNPAVRGSPDAFSPLRM